MMNLKESFMAKNTKIYDEFEGIFYGEKYKDL